MTSLDPSVRPFHLEFYYPYIHLIYSKTAIKISMGFDSSVVLHAVLLITLLGKFIEIDEILIGM